MSGGARLRPDTDTLLILRYAFGFRGAALIAGAVGTGCSRCEDEPIEAYLSQFF